jgi:hypothetical protein
MKFNASGLNTSSGSVANPTNIGDDSSGLNNHLTPTNIVVSDCNMPDSPENNFNTQNPLSKGTYTFAKGNLKISRAGGTSQSSTIGTISVPSGKWYWEVKLISGQSGYPRIGMFNTAIGNNHIESKYPADNDLGARVWGSGGGTNSIFGDSNASGAFGSYTNGDVLQFALDMDNYKMYMGKNDTWYTNSATTTDKANISDSSANPAFGSATNLDINAGDSFTPCIFSNAGADIWVANFGQDASFAGSLTGSNIGTATPDEGAGVFKYAPPSGYLALCTANLPDTNIGANSLTQADEHFGTLTYTGDGQSSQNIVSGATGIGGEIDFQPDFVWIKNRTSGYSHQLQDSNRGFVATKILSTNQTAGEGVASATGDNYGHMSEVEANGFTVTHTLNSNNDGGTIRKGTHFLNDTYVAWNWKAGGTTPLKTYKVVVVSDSGNKYRFRNSADSATFGASAVALDLQEGGTYTFDYSDSTATSHPFRFSTTSDGTHGGGSEYTTGVVKDDTAKTTIITVPASAPTLYYYCSSHSGMGGQVNTNATFGQTNFDGSVLSVSQANTTAGFSIVTYTGTSSAGTIGHGLGAVPKMYIVKNRDATSEWRIYNENLGNDKTLKLHLTDASADSGNWSSTTPTSSVFNVATGNNVNDSSEKYVAYCFAEVEGYSKIGSYKGNGDTDGTYVFTGFRPAWIMFKTTTIVSHWTIVDNARSTYNVVDDSLYADTSAAELTTITDVDFLSNGFKWRGVLANETNVSGQVYIYMAFAEAPFKYANAK